MKSPIDYSAFDETDLGQFKDALKNVPKYAADGAYFWVLVFAVFAGVPSYLFGSSYLATKSKLLSYGLPVGLTAVIMAMVWLARFGHSELQKQSIKLAIFAERNQLSYGYRQKVHYFSPLLITSKGGAVAHDRLTGHYQDLPLAYAVVTKPKRYHVITISFPTNFPHVVLDCRANNELFTNLPSQVKEFKRISLEGNFNDYFQLYSEASDNDTLVLITPNVMQSIMDGNHGIDVELAGTNLILFMRPGMITRAEMEAYFKLIEAITPALRHYASHHPATNNQLQSLA